MVDKQRPGDEPTDGIDDLEEPSIEGPEPKPARDYADDPRPGCGIVPEDPFPLRHGGIEEDGRWTGTGPATS